MIVLKFGGTSLGNAQRIKEVTSIVLKQKNKKPVVIVSAVGGITDALLKAGREALIGLVDTHIIEQKHKEIIKELKIDPKLINNEIEELKQLLIGISMLKEISPRTSDRLVSYGERMSAKIVASYFKSVGAKAQAHNSYDLGLVTTDEFQNATPLEKSNDLLKKNITKLDHIPIITGFFGKTEKGDIATLGRGGSDYSAAIIGAAIDALEIQIWTDVNGIMTCDPRVIKEAKTLQSVSFAEASELAYFGAKVLHPKTILPAVKKGIPVRVLNTFQPNHEGTVIVSRSTKTKEVVKGISFKKKITMINIQSARMLEAYGFLGEIFQIFKKNHIIVDMIATTEVSVTITISSNGDITDLIQELKQLGAVTVDENNVAIVVVGEGIKQDHEFAGKTLTALGKERINTKLITQGSSQINLSMVVSEKDHERAIKILHNEYFG